MEEIGWQWWIILNISAAPGKSYSFRKKWLGKQPSHCSVHVWSVCLSKQICANYRNLQFHEQEFSPRFLCLSPHVPTVCSQRTRIAMWVDYKDGPWLPCLTTHLSLITQYQVSTWLVSPPVPQCWKGWAGAEMPCSMGTQETMIGTRDTLAISLTQAA